MAESAAPTLRWEIKQGPQATHVFLQGDIDETAPLDRLAKQLSGSVQLDTLEVTRINSVGVREWIGFMRALLDTSQVILQRCSPAVVAQLNSIYNFRAGAAIESVAAPFYCPACDQEQLEIISVPKQMGNPGDLVSGTHTCRTCGGALEFDDLPERYFLFAVS